MDEQDVAGMAGHMVALAHDPALAARLGLAAREPIASEFTIERSIAGVGDLTRSAVEAAGGQA